MNDAPRPLPEDSPLWRLMQRIEYCRHRAERAEARGANGSAALRNEMVEVAGHWRDLAREIERLDKLYGATARMNVTGD